MYRYRSSCQYRDVDGGQERSTDCVMCEVLITVFAAADSVSKLRRAMVDSSCIRSSRAYETGGLSVKDTELKDLT